MNCKVATLLVAATIVSGSGCDRLDHRQALSVDNAGGLDTLRGGIAGNLAPGESPPAQRFIAEIHTITATITESDLEKSWDALTAFCQTIQCEILSSRLTTKAEYVTPESFISVRVAPRDTARFLAEIERFGKIAQHGTQRDDKTSAVIDTDAKIKNLNAFRDSLRTMLAKPSATVKDLIEFNSNLPRRNHRLTARPLSEKY